MKNLTLSLILAFYLLPAFANEKPIKIGEPPKVTDELLKRGKVVYTTYCMRCHGEKGDGNGVAAKVINPKPRNFTLGVFKYGSNIKDIYKTVSTGIRGTAMPAWGYLPENDRWAVINYVLKFKKK